MTHTPALRVLTYNIKDGGEDRLPLIADVIREQRPHMAALMEATSRSNVERLGRELAMELVYGEANSEYAVAWLSALRLLGSHNHRLPILTKTLLRVEVTWEGTHLHLYATHLMHGRTEAEAVRRTEEVRAILEVIGPSAGRPHLLVGDLNAVTPGDAVGEPPPGSERGYIAHEPMQLLLDAGYTDCYRTLWPSEPGYTYTSDHPWLRLDHILASPGLAATLRTCRVVDAPTAFSASDHLPVFAEFGLAS